MKDLRQVQNYLVYDLEGKEETEKKQQMIDASGILRAQVLSIN